MKKQNQLLIILGIIFVSFNLRAPITAVGSVAEKIKLDYLLTNSQIGFITTLPLIAFGVISPFVTKISKKISYSKTMILGLILIFFGIGIRSYTNVEGFFIGTIFMGGGIAIGNVLIPSVIKLHFKDKIGFITSIYISSMCLFAAIGAGTSGFLSANLGWKHSLASWIILTVITLVIWLSQHRLQEHNKEHNHETMTDNGSEVEVKERPIWKFKTAWWVTLFMGLQSLIFYSLVAWLPSMVRVKGLGDSYTSIMALIFQLIAIPVTLIVPSICTKFKSQKWIVLLISLLYILGLGLLGLTDDRLSVALGVILMSIGMGGAISVSIVVISLRSSNSTRAGELSGMAQSVGYLLAAIGPFLIGFIFDIYNNWNIPMVTLVLLTVIMGITGWFAGKNKVI